MAGGKGVRLRPLTETTPKPLLPVGGKSIIDYNIDSLMENGIKHISVTVNYLHEQIEEHFAEPVNGVQIDCIKEPQFLGTIGATQFVTKFYNDVVLVMNSDLLLILIMRISIFTLKNIMQICLWLLCHIPFLYHMVFLSWRKKYKGSEGEACI